jgi:hypothetical protein
MTHSVSEGCGACSFDVVLTESEPKRLALGGYVKLNGSSSTYVSERIDTLCVRASARAIAPVTPIPARARLKRTLQVSDLVVNCTSHLCEALTPLYGRSGSVQER